MTPDATEGGTVSDRIEREKVSVLFVCTGNICRSPTAEAVFRRLLEREQLADRIAVDSAGTHGYHVGDPPDRRAQAAAKRRGYDMGRQRARRLEPEDCRRHDYLIVMDSDNYRIVRSFCSDGGAAKLHRFLEFASQDSELDVPDPYYGGDAGFEHVLDLIESAASGLLATIKDERLKEQPA